MSHELLLNELWQTTVSRLGGVAAIDASAREKRAFLRPREVKSATDLLRLILAYCLGGMGLRSTSAWAASAGLADLSNVALLQRLRNCGAWMEHLVGLSLGGGAVPAADGRRIRLLDGTTVPKAGTSLDANAFSTNTIGELYRARWRIEMAFKRLKSLIGLSGPPGEDPEVAKTWILAHLLMILLLGPHASAPEISPRMAA